MAAQEEYTVAKPTILVATWDEGLFAVSGDGRRQEIAHEPVRGLAADGRGGALAIVGGHSLRRRGPGGEWTTLATSEFELSCCMAVGDRIYVGTDDARMLRLGDEDGGIGVGVLAPIESFDRVAGRETWFAGSAIVNGQRVGPPLGIRSVAANSDGSVLFANVHVGGIPRSLDGGRTWQPSIDINCDVHEVCAHPEDPEMVVAAAAVGLCISRDAGTTWSIEREGLHAPHCSAVAFAGDDILVSASVDPFVAEGRVYRRAVKLEGALAAVEGGMPVWTDGKVDTRCIATNGSLVAMADRGGNLYCSEDYGRTWMCSGDKLPTPSGVLIC
jgi:photosystem II stability/assembly factor-like uncharacterized protein